MSEKLLPCPLCGGCPVLTEAMTEHWVSCGTCGASGGMHGRLKLAIEAWNRRTPAPEGETVAWGCFDANGLDDKLVYRDQRRAEDAAFAFTPSLTVKPLYASPVVPVGSGEPVARATCQGCGGHIEGWICQSCDRQFRENDAGNLVFEDQPVVPVGVSREELANWICETPCRPGCSSWQGAASRNRCDCDRDAIIAALRPTDTGASHD